MNISVKLEGLDDVLGMLNKLSAGANSGHMKYKMNGSKPFPTICNGYEI